MLIGLIHPVRSFSKEENMLSAVGTTVKLLGGTRRMNIFIFRPWADELAISVLQQYDKHDQ